MLITCVLRLLLWLHTMFVKFSHIFFPLHNVLPHDCTTICVAVVDKNLGDFQIFTVINNAAVDMLVTSILANTANLFSK